MAIIAGKKYPKSEQEMSLNVDTTVRHAVHVQFHDPSQSLIIFFIIVKHQLQLMVTKWVHHQGAVHRSYPTLGFFISNSKILIHDSSPVPFLERTY